MSSEFLTLFLTSKFASIQYETVCIARFLVYYLQSPPNYSTKLLPSTQTTQTQYENTYIVHVCTCINAHAMNACVNECMCILVNKTYIDDVHAVYAAHTCGFIYMYYLSYFNYKNISHLHYFMQIIRQLKDPLRCKQIETTGSKYKRGQVQKTIACYSTWFVCSQGLRYVCTKKQCYGYQAKLQLTAMQNQCENCCQKQLKVTLDHLCHLKNVD